MATTSSSSIQFAAFKDAIARRIFQHHDQTVQVHDSSELDDFSSYLALESWSTIPDNIRNASYETRSSIPADIESIMLDATSISFVETLILYGFAIDHEHALQFLRKAVSDYIEDACAPPPTWCATRTTECQICEREVPLTYHHLIPRSTHAKVLKKKWHPETKLNAVAWLCRPCHSVVHRVATNEELAREYFTIESLLEREDVLKWRNYAAKQRFGVRRG